jgi:hypothetical protein
VVADVCACAASGTGPASEGTPESVSRIAENVPLTAIGSTSKSPSIFDRSSLRVPLTINVIASPPKVALEVELQLLRFHAAVYLVRGKAVRRARAYARQFVVGIGECTRHLHRRAHYIAVNPP